jgi:hypothetical protein
MASAKPLTISQVEQSKDSSVWVLNTSGSKGVMKGIVNITIVEGNGRAAVVRIPVTAIPVDLTTQATKSALMMSPDFRRLIAGQILTLISEQDALSLLDNDVSRAEQRRLLNINSIHEVQDFQQPAAIASMKAEAAGSIGGMAMSMAHTTEGDEDTVLANVRNNLDSLSQEELQYIVNNSSFHKVKAFVAEHIVG